MEFFSFLGGGSPPNFGGKIPTRLDLAFFFPVLGYSQVQGGGPVFPFFQPAPSSAIPGPGSLSPGSPSVQLERLTGCMEELHAALAAELAALPATPPDPRQPSLELLQTCLVTALERAHPGAGQTAPLSTP